MGYSGADLPQLFHSLIAVVRYESVIHEFDPYFNFRTTKYLAHEGFLEFLNWFDDRGWYPRSYDWWNYLSWTDAYRCFVSLGG